MPKTGALHVVGTEHNMIEDATTDAGIIQVSNPSGWGNGRNWVQNWACGSGGCISFSTPISSVSHSYAGLVVCATGGGSLAARCGEVTHVGQTVGGVSGLGRSTFNSCQGDSGGPISASGVGYGLVSRGFVTYTQTVDFSPITSSLTVGCGSSTYYQGLNGAQSRLNVHVLVS